jgi:SAM-dependent methyltransferase
MSAENRWVLEVMPQGHGLAFDLGGGRGSLGPHVEAKGYRYINLDIRWFENGQPTIVGSAHELPFHDNVFDLVMSKDSLEHFLEPSKAVSEVHRVLKPGGVFIIWVPFIHGFHGDDVYRYTHIGLRYLLRDFEIVRTESPLWVFSLLALIVSAPLVRFRLCLVVSWIRRIAAWLDLLFTKRSPRLRSLAVAYRVVARKSVVV